MRLCLVVLLANFAFGAVPTISNIHYDALTHASVRWNFDITPNSYAQVLFGTTSGVYDFSTVSYGSQSSTRSYGAFAVTGLRPGTTYYFRMTARPNLNDATDICNTDSCGSVEQVLTTLPLPNPHPVIPDLPQNPYHPTHPDTSTYTVIPTALSSTRTCILASSISPTDTSVVCNSPIGLVGATTIKIDTEYIKISSWSGLTGTVASGGRGFISYAPAAAHTAGAVVAGADEQIAATTVALPAGNGCLASSVLSGQRIDTILSELCYGVVIEGNQGEVYRVFPTSSSFNNGYQLPGLAVQPGKTMDDPTHQFIVIRTHSVNAGDFPPFGVRTGPAWHGKLSVYSPQIQCTSPSGVITDGGQVFDAFNVSIHHFWFENLEFVPRSDSLVYPTGQIDPKPYTAFFRFQPAKTGATQHYNVFDRLYLHMADTAGSNSFPPRMNSMILFGGDHIAMLGCYVQASFWRMAVWPTVAPTISPATQINVPQSRYALNSADTPIGMTGSATITLVSGTSGSVLGYINSGGLTVEYTSTATVTCTNCTLLPVTTPTQSFTSYNLFAATISATTTFTSLNLTPTNPPYTNISNSLSQGGTTRWGDWKPLTIKLTQGGPGPYTIDNNYLEAPGQTLYVDPDYTETGSVLRKDVVYTHNWMNWPQKFIGNPLNPVWNGYYYDVRNMLEVKAGLRWLLEGNVFSGNYSYQNTGSALQMAPSIPTETNPQTYTGVGLQHITIRNNTFYRSATIMTCAGAGQPAPDPPTAYALSFTNNLMYDINRYVYSDGTPTFFSGYISIYPGCTDFTIRNNTGGFATGNGPFVHLTGGGSTLGEGLDETNNIYYISQFSSQGAGIRLDPSQVVAAFPRVPLSLTTGTNADFLGNYFLWSGPGGTTTPAYNYTKNLHIGGTTSSTNTDGVDWDQATVTAFTTGAHAWPTGNYFPNPSAGTKASREAAAGFINASSFDYRLKWNSAYRYASTENALVGYDEVALKTGQGTVEFLPIRIDSIAHTVSLGYRKYDSTATCWYYVGTSASPLTWTDDSAATTYPINRFARTITVPVTPSTVYHYSLACGPSADVSVWSGSFVAQ